MLWRMVLPPKGQGDASCERKAVGVDLCRADCGLDRMPLVKRPANNEKSAMDQFPRRGIPFNLCFRPGVKGNDLAQVLTVLACHVVFPSDCYRRTMRRQER